MIAQYERLLYRYWKARHQMALRRTFAMNSIIILNLQSGSYDRTTNTYRIKPEDLYSFSCEKGRDLFRSKKCRAPRV